MESCGSAHYWARRLVAAGHEVALLPAQYVRAYVRRNKTDRADASALIEAFRCSDIQPVPIKSVEHQQIQALHRVRAQWVQTRCSRINTLRGVLREFGIVIPLGPSMAKARVAEALEDAENELPLGFRSSLAALTAAHLARRRERPLHRLQEWALACEKRRGRNRAAVALANRLARIVWATWKYQRAFDGNWAAKAA